MTVPSTSMASGRRAHRARWTAACAQQCAHHGHHRHRHRARTFPGACRSTLLRCLPRHRARQHHHPSHRNHPPPPVRRLRRLVRPPRHVRPGHRPLLHTPRSQQRLCHLRGRQGRPQPRALAMVLSSMWHPSRMTRRCCSCPSRPAASARQGRCYRFPETVAASATVTAGAVAATVRAAQPTHVALACQPAVLLVATASRSPTPFSRRRLR